MFDEQSSTPLYLQIREVLRQRITSGEYQIGARLPSERELAQTYDVSRMTARLALQLLSQDGLIHSRVGKGTFVSQPKINQELSMLIGFTEDMGRRGMMAASRVLDAGQRKADAEVAPQLQIDPGTTLYVLRRVRLANGEPLALETAHLNRTLCPNLFEGRDFAVLSLYRVLRESYGLRLLRAEQVIAARLPDAQECEALGIGSREPVLSQTRTTYDDQQRPVEFVRSVYIGSAFQLRTTLRYAEA
jgi:GntR family transcriptional regulator